MSRKGLEGKPITCRYCGGSRGTLKKDKETGEYYHVRDSDCQITEGEKANKEEMERGWKLRK